MTRSFRYHFVLLWLIGCDPAPAPPKPVAQGKSFDLKAKVSNPATGEFKDVEWSVSASEFAKPARRNEPAGFTPTRDLRVVEVASTRAHSLHFKIVGDGKRFAVLKGGVPFHELAAADEAKAVAEALEFCRVQAGRELYGNP